MQENEWFDNGGRHGGFTQRTKVSYMQEHTRVRTSLKSGLCVWEAVCFPPVCSFTRQRIWPTVCAQTPVHRASLAPTDSVADPRVLWELLVHRNDWWVARRFTSPDVQEVCIALLSRKLSVPRVLLSPEGINLNSSMQVTPTGAVGIQSHGIT